MLRFFDQTPEFAVPDREYARLLGFPVERLTQGRSSEIAAMTRDWYSKNGDPWVFANQIDSLKVTDHGLALDGVPFQSQALQDSFSKAEAHSAVLVALSAGDAVTRRSAELWNQEKPDEYFFMEMFGGAVVEALVTRAGAKLCEWADPQGMIVLPHCSPGYPEWDVSQQNKLLELIAGRSEGALDGRLGVLDSGMLVPKKSLLAVFGISRQVEKATKVGSLIPCQGCSLEGCAYRRKPYFLDTVKDLSDDHEPVVPFEENSSPLTVDARYSTSTRALRKWADSRLTLQPKNDGGYEAVFAYDGTTCSNMGHPIRYLYRISVAGPENEYKVLAARCHPAEDDFGHEKQCEYLKNASALDRAIAQETPLVGQPLEAVLSWSRPASSAGCFCEAGSRERKWAIAYEVLHFQMARLEKERRPAS
ncbi:hypothetical protein [Pelagicoccus sp. SDUM812003]|uniref:hypothetical protein n=1 Tax=Pelagicoccus sp. SDUM812003 TaxID=3041267 RepID=UPI0028101A75|nr:hypothetical protein [Pelagicoccus sp. SDUM812003]MDQ8204532.1 hypothetical protein [Pelagicoccus sp. SDUM812003]